MIDRPAPSSIGFLCIACLLPTVVSGQQPNSATYSPEELHKHFQNVAEAYDMRAGNARLKLRKRPLMHWQNTVRQQEQGALFVWENEGRPQVLGSIFTFQLQDGIRCRHEMISLADGPITSRLDSRVVWSPKQAGLTWKPCRNAAAPSKSAPRRLTQMRAIARGFTATLDIPQRQPANLELIPQPLLRYQAPAAGVRDGAVFSMAVVTDPEILLVVEARESENDSMRWYFAAARAHYHKLELRDNKQLVWEAPMVIELENTNAGQTPWSLESYFIFNPPNPLPPPEQLR